MGHFYIIDDTILSCWYAVSRVGISRAGIPDAVPILYCPDMVGTSRDNPSFSD